MLKTKLLATFLVVLVADSALGKVARTSLEALVARAELIVVAKVERVENLNGRRLAQARVLTRLKGPNIPTLSFLAEPTWTCDISAAETGEEVLLFLIRADKADWSFVHRPRNLPEDTFVIMGSGRGRMPLRSVSGDSYATVWTADVELPKSVAVVPGPEPKYDFIRSAKLDDLVKAIGAVVSKPGAPN